MAKELFNQSLVTSLDDNDRIAFGQPSTGGAKNIKYSVFRGLLAAIGWNFTNAITVIAPTTDMNPATKKYADDLDSASVKKTGNQTIADVKTFSSTIVGSINGNAASVTHGIYDDGSVPFAAKQTFNQLGINIPDFTGTLPANSADTMGVVGDIIYFRKDIYRKTSSDGWIKNGNTF